MLKEEKIKLILASQSPRRSELLKRAGLEFDIVPSGKEEIITKSMPAEVVLELSSQKACDVYDRISGDKANVNKDLLVIGADTVVSIDGKILGKPRSRQDAYDMLKELQGRTHEVYTGVTFVYNENDKIKIHSFNECTKVTFYAMTDKEINAYIETGEPMDKAGAYGIQGLCAVYIKEIAGDYNNVVGLPIARVYQELTALGLSDML